jgi:hypothetical protein
MARRCALLGMLAVMAIPMSTWQTASAAEPTPLVRGDDAGPQVPPAGRSLFDELFATDSGYDIPYPFAGVIGAVNARLAPAAMATALIPLGRSLQRFDAAPDFFRLPRLVLAADGDGAGTTADPLLRDRLYLGYQPAANAIEVISYNEAAGRFEFQRVLNYGDGLTPQVDYADRSICTGCHRRHLSWRTGAPGHRRAGPLRPLHRSRQPHLRYQSPLGRGLRRRGRRRHLSCGTAPRRSRVSAQR